MSRTSARLGKIGHLAELLGRVGADEAEIAIAYLSGELPQRQIASAGAPAGPSAAQNGRHRHPHRRRRLLTRI
ncbi:hypothetical protein, partial [Nonomuraea dietziae]|uniref:hypothetical protein n=1 Tax=Nonomuraea dietziae TaxID=65515 RepID=UPI0031CFF123